MTRRQAKKLVFDFLCSKIEHELMGYSNGNPKISEDLREDIDGEPRSADDLERIRIALEDVKTELLRRSQGTP